jgi:hypothetical protein
LFYKEKELAVKRSELPFVKDEKVREKLESDIYHLNLKLEALKKSRKKGLTFKAPNFN